MSYTHTFSKSAQKFIIKQTKQQQVRILSALSNLPFAGDIAPLQGYAYHFRLRVGDFRIIYHVDHNSQIVHILNIGNRGDVYKSN